MFGVHGNIMRLCPNETRSQTYLWCGLAGGISGLAQSLISCPMELVKTRAQLSRQPVTHCLRNILHHEGGTRALFRGLGITVARDCPAIATYFCTYEMLIDYLRPPIRSLPSTFELLLAGGTAGAVSWFVIYPLDVIKSRIQATEGKQPCSTIECIRQVIHQDGLRAFMRGCSPTMIRAFPTNATTFAVVTWTLYLYESVCHKPSSLPVGSSVYDDHHCESNGSGHSFNTSVGSSSGQILK